MMYYLLIGCVWHKSLAHEKAKQTKQKKTNKQSQFSNEKGAEGQRIYIFFVVVSFARKTIERRSAKLF